MDTKQLALLLGLPETATEAEIQAKIKELLAAKADSDTIKAERDALKTEKEQITLSAITAAVDSAVSQRRITAEKKNQFIELGKKVGLEDLKQTLEAMAPAAKASDFIQHPAGGAAGTYAKLSEVPADKIMELRSNDPDRYKALYKAEYGVECTL